MWLELCTHGVASVDFGGEGWDVFLWDVMQMTFDQKEIYPFQN